MKCPRCQTENQEGSAFCLQCGYALLGSQSAAAPAAAPPRYEAARAPDLRPAAATPMGTVPAPAPYGQAAPSPISFAGMVDPRRALLNIWGPFAGYGTRRYHSGWLMDNRGDRAPDLTQMVAQIYHGRQIPGAEFRQETLTARGVMIEQRPYFMLRRGLVTLGLNISRFGQDLFISIVSYLKPPISNFRALLLGLMVFYALFSVTALPAMINSMAEGYVSNLENSFGGMFGGAPDVSSLNPAGLIFTVCIFGTLAFINNIALFLFLIYSVYKWLKEKDFWGGLRVPPNEFNEDDLMAMEKAVEQTVRMGLDAIGLDQAELKPVMAAAGRRVI